MNLYNETRISFDDLTNVANFNDVPDGSYVLRKIGDIYEPGSSSTVPSVGGGLISDDAGLRINTGETTEIVANKLEVKAGDGLVRSVDGLDVIIDSNNLAFVNSKISVKALKFSTNSSTALGIFSGDTNQGADASSFGYGSGNLNQGRYASSFGYDSGKSNQGTQASSFGDQSGRQSQGPKASSFGSFSGEINQGEEGCGFGYGSAQNGQGIRACAFGPLAGQLNQGDYAFAGGNMAGQNNQPARSIIINANNVTATTVTSGIKLVAGATDVEIVGDLMTINGKAMFNYGIAAIMHFDADNVTKVKDQEGLLQNVSVTNSGQTYLFTFSVSADGYYAIKHNNDDLVKKYTTGTVQSLTVVGNTHHEGVCIWFTYFGN